MLGRWILVQALVYDFQSRIRSLCLLRLLVPLESSSCFCVWDFCTLVQLYVCRYMVKLKLCWQAGVDWCFRKSRQLTGGTWQSQRRSLILDKRSNYSRMPWSRQTLQESRCIHTAETSSNCYIIFACLQVIHSPSGLQIRKGWCFKSIWKSSFPKDRQEKWLLSCEFHLCKYAWCLCRSSDRIKASHLPC